MRKVVTRAFRETILTMYPGLALNPAYYGLMRLLLFKNISRNKEILLNEETLARIEGKTHLLKHKHYCGLDFLKDFQRDVLPNFTWTDHSFVNGRARAVKTDGLDPIVFTHIKAMGKEREVYFEDGRPYTPRSRQKDYKKIISDICTRLVFIGSEGGKRIIEYHNKQSDRPFTKKVIENWAEAEQALEDFKDDEQVYIVAKETLDEIKRYPRPLYYPVYNSDRVFSAYPSLVTIKREIRKALTKGWYECDLRAAQLAIIAKLWEIPSLQEFLETGQNIWTLLASYLSVSEDYKPAIKVALYALCYGASKRNIKKYFLNECRKLKINDDPTLVALLLDHPLIKSILKARKAYIRKVKAQGGLTTISGHNLTLKNNPNIRSLLATEVQAIEQSLILAIYDLAETTNAFQIMIYSFDGLTISFRDSKRIKTWQNKINKAVADRAEQLDIATRLEWEAL